MEYNLRNVFLWRQISTSTKVVPHIFVLAFNVSEILTFYNFDLQKVGQGHEEQFLHSIANVKIYKKPRTYMCALSHLGILKVIFKK